MRCSTIIKTKGSRIVIKKVDKTIDNDITQPYRGLYRSHYMMTYLQVCILAWSHR